MNMMTARLHRFASFKQLHTIISKETIKPSSLTPSHLRTYNLSLIDNFLPNVHMPWIFFYKNYKKGGINILKKSLSESLTQYYPFAGRLVAPSASQIECNDVGVEFLEASNDSRIDDFIVKKEQDETLKQLIPNGSHRTSPKMVMVQLNHFPCGGAALAVSISHKVGDALTMANFLNHWVSVTRGGSLINPIFFPSSTSSTKIQEFTVEGVDNVKFSIRSFVFTNSKLNELKHKVNALGTNPINPTRFEVLASLIFKCAIGAATTKTGYLSPSSLHQMVNMRKKITKSCPQTAAGNLCASVMVKMADSGEFNLNEMITKMRKERMKIKPFGTVQEAQENIASTLSMAGADQSRPYVFSSVCRFPFYEVDFGWGKPARVNLGIAHAQGVFVVFMDTPFGDGIEAIVKLESEEMTIFQENKALLEYGEHI